MAIRFAFAGLRHGHIFSLLAGIKANPETTVVAACEEDAETRSKLESNPDVNLTHDNYDKMLEEVDCDVIAIGDYYAKHGGMVVKALEAGKHVLSDKPICITLNEFHKIKTLATRKNLAVSSQFDLRGAGTFLAARKLIQNGEIGDIKTISFGGQHPLQVGTRPAWYFEQGLHGGTINDIAIHAMDAIPWLTGHQITEIVAARAWNAKTPQFPHFQDCGQLMLKMDNGGGVLGDVSYLAPDQAGFSTPQYWRFLIHGDKGVIELAWDSKKVLIANHSDKEGRYIDAEPNISWPYLPDFLAQVKGQKENISLSTEAILRASELALLAQQAADKNKTNVACG
jgi:predicted dehydrogenase